MAPGTKNWKERITDPAERKVFEALADPQWDFRTIEGISKVSGLSKEQVTEILSKYPELVRRSLFPDASGRDLFTLQERPMKRQEFLGQIRNLLGKSST